MLTYDNGIAFVAENPSKALHKISEIYDRIAFAAVGKYNEFENLRVAGVRLADMRGYSYDRRDVTGRALANAYAQTLGSIFIEAQKPYEVEIVVAEVGDDAGGRPDLPADLRRLRRRRAGLRRHGRSGRQITDHLREHHRPDASLADAVQAPCGAAGRRRERHGRTLTADRSRSRARPHGRAAFKRVIGAQLTTLNDLTAVRAAERPRETSPMPAKKVGPDPDELPPGRRSDKKAQRTFAETHDSALDAQPRGRRAVRPRVAYSR